jgi:hypothetical protein
VHAAYDDADDAARAAIFAHRKICAEIETRGHLPHDAATPTILLQLARITSQTSAVEAWEVAVARMTR